MLSRTFLFCLGSCSKWPLGSCPSVSFRGYFQWRQIINTHVCVHTRPHTHTHTHAELYSRTWKSDVLKYDFTGAEQRGINHSLKSCHSRRREGHLGFSYLMILMLKSKHGPVEHSVTVWQPSFSWDRLRGNQRLPHRSMHNCSCKNMSYQELSLLSTRLGVLMEGMHFLNEFTKDNMWTSPLLRSRLSLWVSRQLNKHRWSNADHQQLWDSFRRQQAHSALPPTQHATLLTLHQSRI